MRSERALQRLMIGLVASMVLLRAILSASLELHPDEAYYWLWSQHLGLSFYDHPPMVALLIRATTVFSQTPFWVRLPGLLAMLGTCWALWRLALEMTGDRRVAHLSVVILNLFPLMAAGFIVTPDVPLLLFWTFGLLHLWRAVQGGGWRTWLKFGLCGGLALLSKYNGILLLGGALAFLLAAKPRLLASPRPWAAGVLALLVFTPVLVFNARHAWVPFKFQLGHGMPPGAHRELGRMLEFLGGQAGAMGGLMGLLVLGLVFGVLLSRHEEDRFLAAFATLPIALFAYTSLKSVAEANWPAAAYPAAAILGARYFASRWDSAPRRCYLWGSGALSLVLILLVYVQAGWGLLPLARWNPRWAKADPTHAFRGWHEAAENLRRSPLPHPRLPILATTHQLAAVLTYASHNALPITSTQKQYSLWHRGQTMPTHAYLAWMASDITTTRPEELGWTGTGFQRDVPVYRDGQVIRVIHIRECVR